MRVYVCCEERGGVTPSSVMYSSSSFSKRACSSRAPSITASSAVMSCHGVCVRIRVCVCVLCAGCSRESVCASVSECVCVCALCCEERGVRALLCHDLLLLLLQAGVLLARTFSHSIERGDVLSWCVCAWGFFACCVLFESERMCVCVCVCCVARRGESGPPLS